MSINFKPGKGTKNGDQFIELRPENLIFPFRASDPAYILNPYVVRYVSGVMESISFGEQIKPAIINLSMSWPISVTYLRPYDAENIVDRRLALCEALVAQFASPEQCLIFIADAPDSEYENKHDLIVSYVLPNKNFLNLKLPYVIEDNQIIWLPEEYSWDKDVNETSMLILRASEATRPSVVHYAAVLKQSLAEGCRINFYKRGIEDAFAAIKQAPTNHVASLEKIDDLDITYEKKFFLSLIESDIDIYKNFLCDKTNSIEDIDKFISETVLDTSKF